MVYLNFTYAYSLHAQQKSARATLKDVQLIHKQRRLTHQFSERNFH